MKQKKAKIQRFLELMIKSESTQKIQPKTRRHTEASIFPSLATFKSENKNCSTSTGNDENWHYLSSNIHDIQATEYIYFLKCIFENIIILFYWYSMSSSFTLFRRKLFQPTTKFQIIRNKFFLKNAFSYQT